MSVEIIDTRRNNSKDHMANVMKTPVNHQFHLLHTMLNYHFTWWLFWDHSYDDVVKWKHCPHYWSFVRGIHRSPADSSHKGQRRGAFMYSLICAWTNGWANHRDAGDVRRHSAHYDVAVMKRGTGWNSESCFGFDLWSVDFIWLYTQFQNTVIPKSRINMGCNISFGVQVQVQPIFVIKRFIMIRYYAQQRLK